MLTRYVDEAAAGNLDVEVARERVREARALARAAAAGYFPRIDTTAAYTATRFSKNAEGFAGAAANAGLVGQSIDFYQVGFDARWELDVFGGTRREVEAAKARAAAAEQRRRAMLATVTAEVARTYIEIRGLQQRLELAREIASLATRMGALAETKHDEGLLRGGDLEVAREDRATAQAVVPPLEAAVRTGAYRLAVLLGKPPEALRDELAATEPVQVYADVVPTGLPSDLLRRRPDVGAAEAELAAATADIGVQTADLFPRVYLTGNPGLESGSFAKLFESASRTWTLVPSVRTNLFSGGGVRAAIDASKARQKQALASYQAVVLAAFEEVESGLVRYGRQAVRLGRLDERVAAGRRAVAMTRSMYEEGAVEQAAVLDTERRLGLAESDQVDGRVALADELIAVYKALGGGWQAFEKAPAPGETGSTSEPTAER